DGPAAAREARGARAEAVGHLARLGRIARRAEEVREIRGEGHPPVQRGAELAPVVEDPVLLAQGRDRADDGHLFAHRREVKADLALTLELDQALVERADERHVPVEAERLVVRERRLVRAKRCDRGDHPARTLPKMGRKPQGDEGLARRRRAASASVVRGRMRTSVYALVAGVWV